MNNRYRWMMIAAAIAVAAIVGVIAYNAGVAQGLEETGTTYPYHWHRPWGFGFFWLPVLFFVFLIVFRRGACHGPHGRYAWLEDWHRREHERMWNGEDDSRRG